MWGFDRVWCENTGRCGPRTHNQSLQTLNAYSSHLLGPSHCDMDHCHIKAYSFHLLRPRPEPYHIKSYRFGLLDPGPPMELDVGHERCMAFRISRRRPLGDLSSGESEDLLRSSICIIGVLPNGSCSAIWRSNILLSWLWPMARRRNDGLFSGLFGGFRFCDFWPLTHKCMCGSGGVKWSVVKLFDKICFGLSDMAEDDSLNHNDGNWLISLGDIQI
jgi:hypothetical protein